MIEMGRVGRVVVIGLTLCLGGCAGITRNALPQELASEACLAGIPDVRAWGAEYSPVFQADLVESIRQARAIDPQGLAKGDGYVNVLAISGGAADGAFGAGLLNGWTAAGTRPTFKLVTGISTGALIAPFVFAGPEFDARMKRFYTSVNTKDIYTQQSPLLSILGGGDSLADTTPLAKLLDECMDEKLMAAVAQGHREGRRLYIGTTNLDAGRMVIWNLGAIAASGRPNALTIFRKVLRASAAIPVMFQPVYIPVEARGKMYDEMHVDGGTTTQVFFYGFMLDLPKAIHDAAPDVTPPPIRIYVIRNAQLKAYYQTVKPRLLPIAGRAVNDLLFTQGIGDLYRIYAIAKSDGIDFKLASIPPDFDAKAKEPFDPAAMTRMFDMAYDLARKGYPWRSVPPGMREPGGTTTAPVAAATK